MSQEPDIQHAGAPLALRPFRLSMRQKTLIRKQAFVSRATMRSYTSRDEFYELARLRGGAFFSYGWPHTTTHG